MIAGWPRVDRTTHQKTTPFYDTKPHLAIDHHNARPHYTKRYHSGRRWRWGGRALAEGSPSHNLRSASIKLNYAQASSSLERYPHHQTIIPSIFKTAMTGPMHCRPKDALKLPLKTLSPNLKHPIWLVSILHCCSRTEALLV